MQIQGRIVSVLPVQGGTSKAGKAWQRQDCILETIEQYPKKICFGVMNDNITKLGIRVGQVLTVDIDISSREYQGKWYTSLTAWSVSVSQNPTPPPSETYADIESIL